eukprot:5557123-Amphidinium_carterae.1
MTWCHLALAVRSTSMAKVPHNNAMSLLTTAGRGPNSEPSLPGSQFSVSKQTLRTTAQECSKSLGRGEQTIK